MPGPPPPPPVAPPSMMPPPPPPPFTPSPAKAGGDGRGVLLQSIRQGAKLKKAETNDRSAPVIGNTTSASNTSSCAPTGGGNATKNSSSMPNGVVLGGLFAGGMPKLRPTGRQLGVVSTSDNSNSHKIGNSKHIDSPSQPQKSYNSLESKVQTALKKQMASDNRNRGPPPPAPVRTVNSLDSLGISTSNGVHSHSNTLQPQSNSLHPNSSTLHRKANSSANLNTLDSPESSLNNNLSSKPVFSHGKPNLAPKPPVLNGKPAAPPKKLIINGKAVSRTQSMKSPQTHCSPQIADDFDSASKFGTVRNMSSLLDKSLGQAISHKTRPALNGRPTAPPPSIPPPHTAPPPPPSKTVTVKPPNHAPPPPPGTFQSPHQAPPPPPPHRTPPQIPTRVPPLVPTNGTAPPPPPRHSSMRDGPSGRRISPTDLDARFSEYFHSVDEFPRPLAYRGVFKVYSSKAENRG